MISVISGGVAAYLSKKTVRVSDRFPNGMFALEPIYAICKSIFTICLLLFSFLASRRLPSPTSCTARASVSNSAR